jgi:hypothetical protein
MQDVDMVIREVHAGLWFLVVGYYFFLFLSLGRRWRKSANPFQLAMSLFFLLLAVGRCFYFIGDFYADPLSLIGIPGSPTPLFESLSFWLQGGAFFQWMALALLSATAGFMIFGKKSAQIAFAVPAVAIGVFLGFFTIDATLRVLLSGSAGALYALFIPLLFWYLAWQSGGNLRKSNLFLGLGFFVLFAGRVIHAGRYVLSDLVFGTITIPGVLAPGLIVIGLILIAIGNEWGQSS